MGSSSAPTRRTKVKLTCWPRDSEHIKWPGSAAPLLCWRSLAASRLRALASGPPGTSQHLSGGDWPSHFSATAGCECNTGAVHTESRLARWWGWEGKSRKCYTDHLQAAPISLAHGAPSDRSALISCVPSANLTIFQTPTQIPGTGKPSLQALSTGEAPQRKVQKDSRFITKRGLLPLSFVQNIDHARQTLVLSPSSNLPSS